jgi:spore germination protein YaaH
MTTTGPQAGSTAPDQPEAPASTPETPTAEALAPVPPGRGRRPVRIPRSVRLAVPLLAVALVGLVLAQGIAGPAGGAPTAGVETADASPASPPGSPGGTSAAATPVVTPGPVTGRAGALLPLSREVFGFLPYWTLDDDTADALRYDHLSTIAFFGIGIRKNGSLTTKLPGYRAYTSENAARITERAHAAGVRVVPTFQLFDKGTLPNMTAFLGDRDAQAAFVGAALDLMAERGADGAVLDFEPLPARLTASFAVFAADFARAIHARDPGTHLTVTLHQGASDTQVATIAAAVDRIFVMAYDYHWRGSASAGPVAPIDGPGGDVRTTLDRFVESAGPAKVILGVPYFGYDWPVAFQGPGATVSTPVADNGGSWSVGYSAATDFLAKHPTVTSEWDPIASSPYFTYRDAKKDTYRQVWYEDERSIAAKYALADEAGVTGIGIWALGMDRGRDDLWDVIRATFVTKG